MAKKNQKGRKGKNSKAFFKSLGIFIGATTIVWIMTSCGEKTEPTIMKNINNKVETTVKTPETQKQTLLETKPETKPEPLPLSEPEETPIVPQGDGFVDDFILVEDVELLSSELQGWSWKRNNEHKPVTSYTETNIAQYGAYYIVETEEKVLYLTFDEGYENGYTETILDILLENGVKATFFVTESYIVNNIELCKRMKDEGHLVGNHSSTHPSFAEISDEEIIEEITKTENTFLELTGYKMDRLIRPPKGEFSERSLYITRTTGNRSIFWSIAYADWLVDDQKGKDYAYNHVMDNYHNGAIILLHAVSESNTEALDDIIKSLKNEGYRFGNLFEVE